jgi:hypothetical protein
MFQFELGQKNLASLPFRVMHHAALVVPDCRGIRFRVARLLPEFGQARIGGCGKPTHDDAIVFANASASGALPVPCSQSLVSSKQS